MTVTNNIGLTLLESSQAQKEITINEALVRLDIAMPHVVLEIARNTPPASPNNGDAYVVGASPTGAWVGYAQAIAYYYEGWRFITPKTGYPLWGIAEGRSYRFTGTQWVRESYDSPEQAYTGTITWTGTTAPSGTASDTYRWSQQGNRVSARIDIVRSVSGSAITSALLSWPGDMPRPAFPASFQVANSLTVAGVAGMQATLTTAPVNNGKLAIGMDASNTNPVITVSSASANLRVLSLIFDYWTV